MAAETEHLSAVPEAANTITQHLGIIDSIDAKVVGDFRTNSTRWVFDVEQTSQALRLELGFKYPSDAEKERTKSLSFMPLNQDFWGAQVWVEEDGDTLIFHATKPCKYRVSLDTILVKQK